MNDWTPDILRGKGFERRPDGQWVKASVPNHNPAGATDPQPDAEPTPPSPAPMEKPTVPRFLALVTISTVRPRDCDGLTSKAWLDCITHGGCHWADDSPEYVEVVFLPKKVRHFEEENTQIEVYRIE